MSKTYKTFVKDWIDLKDSIPLKKPLSIFIEPTNICNFSCITCPTNTYQKCYLRRKMICL